MMGNQSRLIRCAEVLLEQNHRIRGIITDEPSIEKWVKANKLRLIPPSEDLPNLLELESFDLFFSIDNFFRVPDEILNLPKIYAINFHDAPLPRYAGTNATNWALMNGEASHGVTWHVMTNVIDAGDILKQSIFNVSEKDTALTLNAKCYEKSIQCFREFMDELAAGTHKPQQQDLNRRTFFPRWKRPPGGCTIDWSASAKEIYNLYRGLNFGSYWNPLGLPKVYWDDAIFIVKKINIVNTLSSAPPGAITDISDTAIQVSTSTQDISLGGFATLNGLAVSPGQFIAKTGLKNGDIIAEPEPGFFDKIGAIHFDISKHENFWIKQIEKTVPIEIPYAKLPSATPIYSDISKIRLEIPEAILTGRKTDDPPGDFILAGFLSYLHRITDKSGFNVNFTHQELRRFLGGAGSYFSDFVPLRVEIDAGQPFETFYQSIMKQLASVKKCRTYIRDLILRDPNLRESFSNSEILNLPVAIERGDFFSEIQPSGDADLTVYIPDDGKECTLWFNEAKLKKKDIERICEQFLLVLNDIASKQADSVSDISILPDAERRKILMEWNDTGIDYDRDLCLQDIFESQVERTPENVAVVYENQELTYRELDSRANQLAHFLKKLGVSPEVPVGLFMERSVEMVVGIYGIIKAGGAYVPLDPEYPSERVAFMLEDTQVPVLLTQDHLAADLPEHDTHVIRLDTEWGKIAQEPADKPSSGTEPNNLAYIIYTSGSTGKPKGVMNEHRGIVNRLFWMQDEYQLNEKDRVLQKTPFSFDVSVWEFFWPLQVGARLVVCRPGGHRDSDYLVSLITEQQITTLHFVPSMLQVFLEEKGVENCTSIERVICSGEALPYELQKRFFERLNTELHNLYGPTEAAVDVTYWRCRSRSDRRIVPIGFPVANTQMYILDSRLQPVPIGCTGELHIGGVQVARGYLNRPDLTSEKFIPDPFSSQPGSRLYKTGDLSRYLSDGSIEYLGRTDFQVKIRGLRIELGEIESLLLELDDINQCAVMLREDRAGDKRLAAYLVFEAGKDVAVTELRKYLLKKIPDYMVPHHFVRLDAMPLSPNGKTDRRALPKPVVDRSTDKNYVAPRNKAENVIAEIWQELLDVANIGINDSFFDLGGHSLLVVKMLRKLKKSFTEDLTIVDLFQYPTIATLTEFLNKKHRNKPAFADTKKLVNLQIASLKRQRRVAMARWKSHG
jgi:amino acid adenylation domain-containing protein